VLYGALEKSPVFPFYENSIPYFKIMKKTNEILSGFMARLKAH
jgi:hypothetical protein